MVSLIEQLCKEARSLDFYQRKVLHIGIKHARALVKSRSGKNPVPTAPLTIIYGSAGSGKSRTINILKEFLQAILMRRGDNPECPHVLVCAPTGMNNNISQILNLNILCPGTAAENINGQTQNSTF